MHQTHQFDFHDEKAPLEARDVERQEPPEKRCEPESSSNNERQDSRLGEPELNGIHLLLRSPGLEVGAEVLLADELGRADDMAIGVVAHRALTHAVLIATLFCALSGTTSQLAECGVDAGIKPALCGF